MTREEEFNRALAQRQRDEVQARHEAHARFLETRAPELRTPAPVIRDELDTAFAALRTREARP